MSRVAFPIIAFLVALASGIALHALPGRTPGVAAASVPAWVDPPRWRASWTLTSPSPLSTAHEPYPPPVTTGLLDLMSASPASGWRIAGLSNTVTVLPPLPADARWTMRRLVASNTE